METHIDHIQTPVHGIVELEFSIFRLLLKDDQGKIVFCHTFNEAFTSDALHKLELLSLKVVVWPKCLSLVPNQFLTNNHQAILSLTDQDVDQLHIKEQGHPSIGQTALFGMTKDQQLQCVKCYPGVQIKNGVSQLINMCMANLLQEVIYCHIEQNRIWIIAKKKGLLEICNVYDTANEEEVLYFMSAVIDQHYSPKIQVFLGGNNLTKHQNLLSKYLHHVNPLSQNMSETSETPIDSTIYYQLFA